MRNFSRRHAIGLGAAAMAATVLPRAARAAFHYGAAGVNNIGRALVPFTIVNNSGSSEPAYVYYFGTTRPLTPQLNTYYISNLNGDCTLFPVKAPDKIYGHELKEKTVNAFLPQLDGLRMYISIGKPLSVMTDDSGIPIAVSADVEKDNPNYKTVWDFVEGTWHDYTTHTVLHINVTQVDAFGLAFKVEHSGFDPADPTKPITIINGFDTNTARADIFKDLTAKGVPWSQLIISDAGKPVRALMPVKSIDLDVFPKDQLDKYIKDVLLFYDLATNNRLVFSYSGVNYTGSTTVIASGGGAFTFVPDKKVDANKVATSTYIIPAPTTRECYAQNIVSIPNDGPGGALCAALGASFLRSTLIFDPSAGFPVPQADRLLYYQNQPICEYAKIIHKYGINNHAFCYGYDEVADDAGGNRDVFNPTGFTLTINGV